MKKLIIHAGAPKCGSTALQSVLEIRERNGDLSKIGFTFPLEYSRGSTGEGNAGPLFDYFEAETVDNLALAVNFLLKQNRSTIVSEEMLFAVIDKHKLTKLYNEIKSEFQDMVIVTAIREPSSWLLSDYSQHIKANISNLCFPDHVVKREADYDLLSYFSGLVEHGSNFRLVSCDYKNLFNCVSELLGVDKTFLSANTENINTNPSLTSAQLEATRICNILGVNDMEKIQKLEFIYQDFNLKEENKSLLSYIRKKNEGYVEKIKSLKDVLFYEDMTSKNMDNINLNPNPKLNLALNKPTAQSSVYLPEVYGYDHQGACNSNKNGRFGFCTLKENQPWWQIDLQGTYQLSEIKIYNRMDCCQERASTLNVLLSQDALNWELCYSNDQQNVFGGIDGKPLLVNVQHQVARFVRLQLRENEYLHLDEVEIYGIPVTPDNAQLKSSQDEATLSANFYSQDNLPSAPPIIKGVVVRRGDGLGTRLMSILSGRYVCEYFGCNMYVSWINIYSKYYPSNILNAESITEVFEGGKIFKDIDVPLLNEEDFFKLKTKRLLEIEQEQGLRRNGCFFVLSKKQTENISQFEFINWELPWPIVPYGTTIKEVSFSVKDYWEKINWHHSIINQIQKFQKLVNSKPYLVVHIRRGDIIQTLLYDDIPTLHQDMAAIVGRFLPIKTAVKFVLDCAFKDVVVCSECHNSTQIFVDEVKRNNNEINLYITSEFTESFSMTQAAAYDLIIMSDCTKVLTSLGSTFSTCAEFAGNTHQAKTRQDWDNTDWENMANELIAYLDNNDNEMTNERKSLVYLHLSKYVQSPYLSDHYISLSKKHSYNTFMSFYT